jgi:transketolase
MDHVRNELNSYSIRSEILRLSKRANVGHIGSALSVADILVTLYQNILDPAKTGHPERDRFILSKGHATLALYCALALRGVLSEEQLDTFGTNGTLLGVHPEHVLPGIDFCSGSLGHGLSYAVGSALAATLSGSSRKVFVLISDGECNEGSVWEAAMFAAHHQLSNLVLVVDLNGQQALDYTRNVLNIANMGERWKSFGWDVTDVDGHNVPEMTRVIQNLDYANQKPHILVAHTVFGSGVSFMENKIKWHYFPMTNDEYAAAMEEIQVRYA